MHLLQPFKCDLILRTVLQQLTIFQVTTFVARRRRMHAVARFLGDRLAELLVRFWISIFETSCDYLKIEKRLLFTWDTGQAHFADVQETLIIVCSIVRPRAAASGLVYRCWDAYMALQAYRTAWFATVDTLQLLVRLCRWIHTARSRIPFALYHVCVLSSAVDRAPR